MSTSSSPPPQERLPDTAPPAVFLILPHLIGILLAWFLERCNVESTLQSLFSPSAHPYSLMGLGVIVLSMANSYLGGRVVNARVEYDVKLPNLYAPSSNKHATSFNCIQRGHQHLLEQYGILVMSVLTAGVLAQRPNIAGCMLFVVSACRILFAIGYSDDISSRMPPFMLIVFTTNIGVGYGFWMAITAFGVKGIL